MTDTHDPAIPHALPDGKIRAWPVWEDDDDADWIVGVHRGANVWTQIAVCPNERLAKWLADHLDKIKGRGT